LEQLRVESLLPQQWPGMKINIDDLFTHWSRTFYHSGLTDTAVGILLYTLAQVTRARLMAVAVLPETESLIEHTRAALAPVIGAELSGLRRYRQAQNRYGDYALQLAVIIEDMIAAEESVLPPDEQVANRDEAVKGFTILLDVASADGGGVTKADTKLSAGLVEAKQTYRVFTTQFDKVIFPANLVRAELLQEYRHHLDKRVLQQRINLSRLARQFSTKLSRPEVNGWQSSKDEGYIDGGRLPLLISSPSETDIFYQPHLTPVIDCHVSVLVDCSGSMKIWQMSQPKYWDLQLGLGMVGWRLNSGAGRLARPILVA
jgi:cobaltochelatase CobT